MIDSIKRILRYFGILIIVALGLYGLELGIPKQAFFVDRVGTLAGVDIVRIESARSIDEVIRLESTSDLAVYLRVLRPAAGTELPVIILLGGNDTGKDAVELVRDTAGIAFVALDYPTRGNLKPRGFLQTVGSIPRFQEAFVDSPPALSLTLDWLLQQPWVAADRVELVGASLGVPFAAVAGALDDRFSRVWLLHGGGDNVSWVAHAGRKLIANDATRRLAARVALFLVYGNSFDTVKWVQRVAPRPTIIVAARDDDYVPKEAQLPLIELAKSEAVELIWTDGPHVRTDRDDVLQQLLATVLERIPL